MRVFLIDAHANYNLIESVRHSAKNLILTVDCNAAYQCSFAASIIAHCRRHLVLEVTQEVQCLIIVGTEFCFESENIVKESFKKIFVCKRAAISRKQITRAMW